MQLNSQPSISVIIIVFNGARYIRDAIESVFNQTFKDWEIVVVDDGSTDNTKQVLEPWIKEGKIRYFYQQNKGTSGAYNTGTNLAKGKYIKYLDCDDLLYSEQLELQVKHLQNMPETVISVTDFEFDFDGKTKKKGILRLDKENQLAQFIKDNPCPGHTILISRNLLIRAGGYDEELFCYEDTDLWVRAILAGGIFEKIDYIGCCYRILGGSVSADPEKMFLQRCKYYEKLNRVLLPKFNQMSDRALRQLLLSNLQLTHMCFARRIKPGSFIPNILAPSSMLYAMNRKGWRKMLFNILGIEKLAFLKYLKLCLNNSNYKLNLLGVPWREG